MERFSLISVIVPCYKVEQYLPKCIDSILAQTYTNLEILLVDDGSPDKCGEICDAYAKKDERIKVIHKENGGLADARNAALDIAAGEWFVCVDSDDYVTDDYIETLYRLVCKYRCKIAVAQVHPFLDGTEPTSSQPNYQECVYSKTDGLERMFYQTPFDTSAWCKIYHRSLFSNDIRYPFGLIYEDLPTTYRLFLRTDKVAYCNQAIYNYLLRKDSLEGQPFNVRKLDSALRILEMLQCHSSELQFIEKAVRCRIFSFCLHILLEMPSDYPDGRKHILMEFVKQNRTKVLLDKKARIKARLGALLSFCGLTLSKKILNCTKKRK